MGSSTSISSLYTLEGLSTDSSKLLSVGVGEGEVGGSVILLDCIWKNLFKVRFLMNLFRSLKSWNELGCIVGENVRHLLSREISSLVNS